MKPQGLARLAAAFLLATLVWPSTADASAPRCPQGQREVARVTEIGPFAGYLTTSRLVYNRRWSGAHVEYGFGLGESGQTTFFFYGAAPPIWTVILRNAQATRVVPLAGAAFEGPFSVGQGTGLDKVVLCTVRRQPE